LAGKAFANLADGFPDRVAVFNGCQSLLPKLSPHPKLLARSRAIST
jgi:hypothetical protein